MYGKYSWGAALVAVLVLAGASARAEFKVVEEKDTITIVHVDEPSWKAVVDRKHGGTIRHFSLPADGPNLVSTQNADHLEHSFRGMFSVFYMGRVTTGDPKKRSRAKGTLWGRSNDTARLRVVSRSDKEVQVETTGTGFGWRLLGPATEPVVEYRQTYTFLPDRIQCAGELKWVYQHDLKLEVTEFEHFLDYDMIKYPLHVTDDSKLEMELPITGSNGDLVPKKLAFPFTMLVDLKNDYRLQFRPLHVSPIVEKSRWYCAERPWQQDWAQMIAFEGDIETVTENFPGTKVAFPEGKFIPYSHEMQISRTPVADLAVPKVTITSPKRDGMYKLGDKVHFAATAVDSKGNPLPIEWQVFPYPGSLKTIKTLTAPSFDIAIPGKAKDFDDRDILWATATVKDSMGRKSQQFVSVDVDLPKPPKVPPAPAKAP
jgi:hypothetical protein